MALSYRYERTEEYRQTFDRLLAFYLNRLPADMVPYWDLVFSDGDGEPRDSSSAKPLGLSVRHVKLANTLPGIRERDPDGCSFAVRYLVA